MPDNMYKDTCLLFSITLLSHVIFNDLIKKFIFTIRTSLAMSAGVLKAQPGKLDIKKREPGILLISLKLFIVETSDYDVIIYFRVDSMSLTASFKKSNVMMT